MTLYRVYKPRWLTWWRRCITTSIKRLWRALYRIALLRRLGFMQSAECLSQPKPVNSAY